MCNLLKMKNCFEISKKKAKKEKEEVKEENVIKKMVSEINWKI